MRIEEARPVEVIRHRAVIVTRGSGAQAQHAHNRSEGGKSGEQSAAGEERHGGSTTLSQLTPAPRGLRLSRPCRASPMEFFAAWPIQDTRGHKKLDGVGERE